MIKPHKNLFRLTLLLATIQTLTACQTSSHSRCIAGDSNSDEKGDACVTQLSENNPENLYLEEVYGKKALAWVEKHNQASLPKIDSDPRYTNIKDETLKIMNDPHKLLNISFIGDWAYNFWQDEKNIRGIWRRTSIKNHLNGKPEWDILLDIDELAKKENKNWTYAGVQIFKDRALIKLSDGGKDAHSLREFDIQTKLFVKDGFILPEGKNDASWLNEDELFLGLALGENEVTESGYPRQMRIWRRGEDFKKSKIVFSGDIKNVAVSASATRDEEESPARYKLIHQSVDFFNTEKFILQNDGSLTKLNLPTDSSIDVDQDQVYIHLKSDWKVKNKTYKVGSLLNIGIEDLIKEAAKFKIVFAPTKIKFLQNQLIDNGRVFLTLSENVNSHAVELIFRAGKWEEKSISLPKNSTIGIDAYSKKHGLINFSSEGFISPKAIFTLDLATNKLTKTDEAPSYFDSSPYIVKQFFTQSLDGTSIPYYVIHKKSLKLNGKNPTIINAYGGFEISKTPVYSPITELAWLKNDGVWIVANIRGGGEYGPKWHTSVIKENRQRVFEDFFAVAEDVIRKKISSPQHMGAVGGSNGGLLMGVAMTQRPELYNAIAIQVPLLDMLRYHKLLAGASWVGEYGDPEDPKMREIIAAYSPYQNIKANAKYPEVFFMTSTADDRVHPGHARRTAAKMEEMGHPFLYYENTEGGHGGSANNTQRAKWTALQFVYFMQKLMN